MPYCQVFALFINFFVVVTGPELSLEEQELVPLVPLEEEEEVVGGAEEVRVAVVGVERADVCCRSSALSLTSLIPPRLVRASRGVFVGGGGGGVSRKTESSSVSSDGQRDSGSRGLDPTLDTDFLRPDALRGEQASQARGEESCSSPPPPPNTSPRST